MDWCKQEIAMHYFMKYEANAENIIRFLNEFKCQRCEHPCCIRIDDGVVLLNYEANQIAEGLGISHRQFKDRYTFVKDGKRFIHTPCPFYSKELKGCTIHSFRPQVCRQFPFSRYIQMNGKRYMTVNVDCPSGKIIGEKYGVKPESVGVGV